jgi:hypothetical protein
MSKIYVDEILPKENARITAPNLQLPAGSVIQVQQAKNDTQGITITTDVLANTGISLSITPQSASNKVFVSFNVHYVVSTNASGMRFALYRSIGGVDTQIELPPQNYTLYFRADAASGSTMTFRGYAPIEALDSPNTTSAVTYKLYAEGHNQSGGINNGGCSYIKLMEIAG